MPVCGSIGVSVEEGLRSIAADAAGDTDNALYDKTLTRASGAGLLSPASTGKAAVGPASNEFKAEARLCSGTPEE